MICKGNSPDVRQQAKRASVGVARDTKTTVNYLRVTNLKS